MAAVRGRDAPRAMGERTGSQGPPQQRRSGSRGPAATHGKGQGKGAGGGGGKGQGPTHPRPAPDSDSDGESTRDARPSRYTRDAAALRRRLEHFFGDESFAGDYPLLTATDKDRYVAVEYVCRRLQREGLRAVQPDDILDLFDDRGQPVDGWTFLQLSDDRSRVRRVPKFSSEATQRAKETIIRRRREGGGGGYHGDADASANANTAGKKGPAAGKGGGKGGGGKKGAKGAAAPPPKRALWEYVEYYFSSESLPFDARSLEEFDNSGTFPLHYITTAPALQKMGVKDEDVIQVLQDLPSLEVVNERAPVARMRVRLLRDLSQRDRGIALRTLERRAEHGDLGVRRARQLEEEYQEARRRRRATRDADVAWEARQAHRKREYD